MAKERITLADALDSNQAEKHNSDLGNLASALEYLTAADRALERRRAKHQALREEILKAAAAVEAGEVLELDEVSDLYERARKISPSL